MQSYLFIGGDWDSLNVPVADDAESMQMVVDITEKETYIRDRLSVGDVSTYLYIHESPTTEMTLNRLVESFKAWAIHQPGGRR
jgi:hypothetical protein